MIWLNDEGKPFVWLVDGAWELIILEDGERIRAVDLFRRVEHFWTELIQRYGIDEPQDPLPPEIAASTQ